MLRLDLRRLILLLCLFSITLAVGSSLVASVLVQRGQLLSNSLESSHVYAQKLASLATSFLKDAKSELTYAAQRLQASKTAEERADAVEHVHRMTNRFNSVVLTGADGIIQAESPKSLGLVGRRLFSPQAQLSASARTPMVSEPFRATTGRWLITVTVPTFDAAGQYTGYFNGTLYLHEPNSLEDLLSRHGFQTGTYTYVVDRSGVLIYHPTKERVGNQVHGNPVIDAVVRGEHGSRAITNSLGTPVLAGYAPVPIAGWGIVVQTPETEVLSALDTLIWHTVRTAAPFVLLTLIIIAWLAARIARPLGALAAAAHQMDAVDASRRIHAVRCWYHEAAQLKRALLTGLWAINHKIKHLKQETASDALSGLLNRRGFEAACQALQVSRTPTAIVVLDIDRFKHINDTYGHPAGDAVIRLAADRMRRHCRHEDVAARTGGEEFVLLLPHTTPDEAQHIAHQLRKDIHHASHEAGTAITVSGGISHFPHDADTVTQVWQYADAALYHAKRTGRDQVCRWAPDTDTFDCSKS